MARLSDDIEAVLQHMLAECEADYLEFTRNDLAIEMNCVPSQITYVLRSRFTNSQGYIVESRRGGGGSIRLRRISNTEPSFLVHLITCLPAELSAQETEIFIRNLADSGEISERERQLLLAVSSSAALRSLPRALEREMRASLISNMLTALASTENR